MTDDLMERIEGCIANAEHDDEHETLIDARDRIEALEAQLKTVLDREAETHRRHDAKVEAQAAEIDRLREWSLKAFTIVEWVSGEGKLLEYPCYDADDMLGDGVELLGVYSADDARAALGGTK